MVTEGNQAPDFTVPRANGEAYNDIEEFTLSETIGTGPIVLAFFPAAFTSGCTEEMCTFQDSLASFERLDAHVFGISVDLPFAQNIWMQEHNLEMPMLSDWNHEVIERYDVVLHDMYGLIEAAERSVFVIDDDGEIVYRWVRENGNPDFEKLIAEIERVVTAEVRDGEMDER